MPEKKTIERAREARRRGKASTTQAGELVREEQHFRTGKYGARSIQRAIAIALSKARRAGASLPPPKKGTSRRKAKQGLARAKSRAKKLPEGARATMKVLRGEGRGAASKALSKQARAARRRKAA